MSQDSDNKDQKRETPPPAHEVKGLRWKTLALPVVVGLIAIPTLYFLSEKDPAELRHANEQAMGEVEDPQSASDTVTDTVSEAVPLDSEDSLDSGLAPEATPETAEGFAQDTQAQPDGLMTKFVGKIKNIFDSKPSDQASEKQLSGKTELGTSTESLEAIESKSLTGSQLSTETQTAKDAPGGCYTVAYRHRDISSHRNGEACAFHRNFIQLKGFGINPKSVCVRVNNVPVKHQFVTQKKKTGVVIGAIAGPKSVITASYCTKGEVCKDPCKIPKDAFMSAIGGGDASLDSQLPVVHWDSTNPAKELQKEEKEVDRELAEFKGALSGTHQGKSNLFSGWVKGEVNKSCWRERI